MWPPHLSLSPLPLLHLEKMSHNRVLWSIYQWPWCFISADGFKGTRGFFLFVKRTQPPLQKKKKKKSVKARLSAIDAPPLKNAVSNMMDDPEERGGGFDNWLRIGATQMTFSTKRSSLNFGKKFICVDSGVFELAPNGISSAGRLLLLVQTDTANKGLLLFISTTCFSLHYYWTHAKMTQTPYI